MGLPVRVVCGACLQSLEGSSGDDGTYSGPCPFCGYQVNSYRAEANSPTQDRSSLFSPVAPSQTDSPTMRIEADPAEQPDRIGRFLLREPLGEGGYGQVFRAYDPRLDRDVALKVLKATRLNDKAIERFFREARAAARLDHPNIVGLHDAGQEDGRCWIAYQLVRGQTLSQIRNRERLTPAQAVRIVRDLALALNHAHSRGVFHRDLKPANVMIDETGRTRLTDFGLARRVDLDSDLTREGTVLGTPHYMSPEAAAGRAHEADARSDVYSLGVILYELICGRRPTDVPSDSPPWRYRPNPTPPTPRSVQSDIPAALDRICMRALAFKPEDRFPDGRSLAEALEREIDPAGRFSGSSEIRPAPIGPLDPEPTGSRRWVPRLAMSAVVLGAVGVSGLAVLHGTRAGSATSTPAPVEANKPGTTVLDRVPAAKPDGPVIATPPAEPPKAVAPAAEPAYIGNAGSRKYHRAGCSSMSNMAESNKRFFPTAEEARDAGFSPCGKCNRGDDTSRRGSATD